MDAGVTNVIRDHYGLELEMAASVLERSGNAGEGPRGGAQVPPGTMSDAAAQYQVKGRLKPQVPATTAESRSSWKKLFEADRTTPE